MTSQSVILTGAAGGVGVATSRVLLDKGYVVYAGYIDDWELEKLQRLQSQKPNLSLIPVALDLRSQDQIDAVVSQVEQDHPALKAIIANGALAPEPRPFEHTDVELTADTLDVNLLGNLRLFRRALPLLEKNRSRIVFVSSIVGKVPMALELSYAASKHACEAMCRIMHQELKRKGITISTVNPGVIGRTYMAARAQQSAKEFVAKIDGCSPDDVEAKSFDLGNPDTVDFTYQKPDPYYRISHAGLAQMSTIAMQNFSTPESVTRYIIKAMESPNPKANYFAGIDSKSAAALNWLLPSRLMDALFAKVGVQ